MLRGGLHRLTACLTEGLPALLLFPLLAAAPVLERSVRRRLLSDQLMLKVLLVSLHGTAAVDGGLCLIQRVQRGRWVIARPVLLNLPEPTRGLQHFE